ncbi:hypothetical protein JCM3766R1_002163 [Sporobolomyces carnicolor]
MLQRSLGHYERFSLARHNVGHAPAVVFTASVLADSFNSRRLVHAIASLLGAEPLLSSSIASSRSADPKYTKSSDVRPDQILAEVEDRNPDTRDALLEGIQAMTDLDVEQAPLWRVYVYPVDPETNRRRLSLAIHHVIGDGSAARNLFASLLSLALSENPTPLDKVTSFPPSLEDTVDVRPPKLYLVRTLFSLFVAPRLPSFLRPKAPSPFWPNPAVVSPTRQSTDLRVFSFPSKELSLALSTVSKSPDHRVETVHPVLVTAAVFAIKICLLRRRRQGRDAHVSHPPRVVSQSPVSLRSPSLGHASSCTGNYVCSISLDHSQDEPTEADVERRKFWDEAREYARHIKLDSSLADAKAGMGMLAYLSPGVVDERDERGNVQTGWEKFLLDEMGKPSRECWSGGSFEVSNLGRMKDLTGVAPDAVEGVCWAQPGSAKGVGLGFNTVSHGGIFSCSVTWRQGSIDEGTVDDVFKLHEALLLRVANGEVDEDATLGDLSNLLP